MKVYALGDLHLSLNSGKPMDVFGEVWNEHFKRICDAWNAFVAPEDIVLLPGDISWAMRLEDAMEDILAISALPGKKVLLRGNHDYWWNSIAKIRACLPENMYAIQNDSLSFENVALAGSRGWICPGSNLFDGESDRKIYERECIRLEMSLQKMDKNAAHRIAMLHYPPCNEKRMHSDFMSLMESYGVDTVVYGHLHDKACKNAFEGERNGVEYLLCSADYLSFSPKEILSF